MALRRRGWLGLVLSCAVLAGPSGAEEPPPAPLEALLAPDASAREAAVAAWRALGAPPQAEAVRTGLRSARPEVAQVAALVASPWWLDADDLERWSRATALDPLARFAPPEGLREVTGEDLMLGSRDLPALWAAIGTRDLDAVDVPFGSLHRCLLPEQVPDLVALLPRVQHGAFPALVWEILNQAQQTASDEQHDLYVQAFRYALHRLRAVAEGKPVPRLEDVPPLAPRPGLPAAVLELARAAWSAAGAGQVVLGAPQEGSDETRGAAAFDPGLWLARWLRRTAPVEADLDLLLELTQLPHAPMQARAWAGRQVARFEGRTAGRVRERLLGGGRDDDAALAAAAQAAALGRSAAWQALGHDPSLGWHWLAAPLAAEERVWRALTQGGLPEGLEPDARVFDAYDLGIEVPAAALARLAERLRAGGAPPRAELAFFARVVPESMTVADAERIAARWLEAPRFEASDDDLVQDLAALEVRAPEALARLLRRWADPEATPEGREAALGLLARLGDTALAEALAATVPAGALESVHLARVKHPAMEVAFQGLLERATSEKDLEREAEALQALAILRGCPEALAGFLGPHARDHDDPGRWQWEEARALVLAGDPIGAVLVRTRAGTDVGGASIEAVVGLGRTRDPRVTQRLAAWRDAPGSGLHWPATAALALQGDAAARAAWERLLRSGRTFVIEDLQHPAFFTLDGDAALVRHWIEMLGTNCCLAWNAGEALGPLFPTAPFEALAGDGGRACATARAWYALHGPHLVWSRLLDGFVPGAR